MKSTNGFVGHGFRSGCRAVCHAVQSTFVCLLVRPKPSALWGIAGALCVCGSLACRRDSPSVHSGGEQLQAGAISVFTVNYPLQYFAERIGGHHVRAICPVPSNQDPAYWQPNAETIVAYQQADLILLNGASYAKWTNNVSLPATKLVNTSARVEDQYIRSEDAITHSHGPGKAHSHAGIAGTTWLDPQLALAQAEAVRQAFCKMKPQADEEFEENFAALEADLIQLDRKLGDVTRGMSGRAICFSHPVYQYLQQRYDLDARSVLWEPDEVPSEEMWEEMAEMLNEHRATWMLWESAPLEENVTRLRELGLQSTVYDPCGKVPTEGDFLTRMEQNVRSLARALGK